MDAQTFLDKVDFWPARIILSATELRLFHYLGNPAAASDVASSIGADVAATTRLLDALTALEILNKADGSYRIKDCLQEALGNGPQSIIPMLQHRAVLWHKWSELTNVVVSGEPEVDRYEDDQRPDEEIQSFIGAMKVVGTASAIETVKAINLSCTKNLLDIGGGPGVYAMEFARSNPGLKVTLLDMPRVCKIARRNTAGSDVENQIDYVEGEVLSVDDRQVAEASGGKGYDTVFASNLIHSMSPTEVEELFFRCAKWIKPGGQVVIKDFLLDDSRTMPSRAAIFDLNMLVCTPGGHSYTWAEAKSWLQAAFKKAKKPQPVINRIDLPDSASAVCIARCSS